MSWQGMEFAENLGNAYAARTLGAPDGQRFRLILGGSACVLREASITSA